jgi:hypothetical protein
MVHVYVPLYHVIYHNWDKGSLRQSLHRRWDVATCVADLHCRIDACYVANGGHTEQLWGRTETWSVSPYVDMLPPPPSLPTWILYSKVRKSKRGLMNYPVCCGSNFNGQNIWNQERSLQKKKNEDIGFAGSIMFMSFFFRFYVTKIGIIYLKRYEFYLWRYYIIY